jgi:hypothetical protein
MRKMLLWVTIVMLSVSCLTAAPALAFADESDIVSDADAKLSDTQMKSVFKALNERNSGTPYEMLQKASTTNKAQIFKLTRVDVLPQGIYNITTMSAKPVLDKQRRQGQDSWWDGLVAEREDMVIKGPVCTLVAGLGARGAYVYESRS